MASDDPEELWGELKKAVIAAKQVFVFPLISQRVIGLLMRLERSQRRRLGLGQGLMSAAKERQTPVYFANHLLPNHTFANWSKLRK